MGLVPPGRLHHLELWVQDYPPCEAEHYAAYVENADGFEVELVAA